MPTRFIHSRSLVIPSVVTLLAVQCHQVRGRAEGGGSLKPSDSGSAGACASTEASEIDKVATTAAYLISFTPGFSQVARAKLKRKPFKRFPWVTRLSTTRLKPCVNETSSLLLSEFCVLSIIAN